VNVLSICDDGEFGFNVDTPTDEAEADDGMIDILNICDVYEFGAAPIGYGVFALFFTITLPLMFVKSMNIYILAEIINKCYVNFTGFFK
jgi:hypothetical protein